MYRIKHNPPAPAPLDFNTPRHTYSVADALGPDTGPHDESPVPTLDTAALLTDAGLPGHAVRSIVSSLLSARSFSEGIWGGIARIK